MQVLFCSSPISQNQPDEIYEPEALAVEKLEKHFGLIDFESLVEGDDAARAVRRVRVLEPGWNLAIYRGWMMTPAKYSLLYEALRSKELTLINTPSEYKHCHYLPEWIDLFPGQTPDSVWIPKSELEEDSEHILSKIQSLSCRSCIVKDYVKSEKHKWAEACFIPDTSDVQHIEKVVTRFRELRGESLEGGLVFRKFEQFKSLVAHSKSGMPLTKEFRLFVLDGKIIYWVNYWEEGDYAEESPPVELFAELASRPKSRFFSMDIAQTTDGRWLVVELGDAQVTGIPDEAQAMDFYRKLFDGLQSVRSD